MLEIESLCVSYGAVQVLRDVSLRVEQGEVLSILGANGAGKSTLLNTVAGLVPARSGRLLLQGEDITCLSPHHRPSRGAVLVPEGRGVFADQTVADNLLLGSYHSAIGPKELQRRLERGYELFPRLRDRRGQIAGTLSGGEQQMLAIARALMGEPRLLMLDEPSLGLAPIIVRDIFRAVAQLRGRGITVLLVEQMAHQALAIADRAYVLENGRITLEGPAAVLRNDKKVRAAYLGAH